jgi:hypothetical protein
MSEIRNQFSGSVSFGPQLSVPKSPVKITFADTLHVWHQDESHPDGGVMVPLPVKVVAITDCPQVPE